jgi:Domain of unknown function (DUF4389)
MTAQDSYPPGPAAYPVQFSVDYPDRPLDRLTSFFRIFTIIPIAIVAYLVSGRSFEVSGGNGTFYATTTGGLLFLPPLLMILFRQKYPRWWFDWNLQLQRFGNRVWTYLVLMNDQYPSTDENQWLHLDYPYPDAERELNRWLPLVKWFLAIPHYIVLFFLDIGVFVVVIVTWFVILFTGRYPLGMFRFVEGVARWHNRVIGYALTLVTDRYPPFRLAPLPAGRALPDPGLAFVRAARRDPARCSRNRLPLRNPVPGPAAASPPGGCRLAAAPPAGRRW